MLLVAPINRTSSDSSSTKGSTCSLYGIVTPNPFKSGLASNKLLNPFMDFIGKASKKQSFKPSLSNFSVKYCFEKECPNG